MSNTTRPFNIIRRRPNLLDALIPKSPSTRGYRLKASETFSGVFTQILEADIGSGYLDPTINPAVLHTVNNPGHIRVVFNPQNFNGVAGIVDARMFWLKFQPVDFAGAAGAESPPVMVLPEENLRGDSVIMFTGTAPNVTAPNALPLYLSLRMQDITIRNNEASASLFVATELGGSETEVDGGATTLSQLVLPRGAQGCLVVRGGGATANFTVSCTSFLPL